MKMEEQGGALGQDGTCGGEPVNDMGFPSQTPDPSCDLTGLALNSKVLLSH